MAELMNPAPRRGGVNRTVCGQRGGVTFRGWIISLSLHLVIFVLFGFVQFSHTQAASPEMAMPAAKVEQIKKLVEAAPVIPKPKVSKPAKSLFASRLGGVTVTNEIFGTVKPAGEDWTDTAIASAPASGFSSGGDVRPAEGTEFFGSFTNQRRVCYVVDCSGSMQGMFGRVRKELKESIGSLQHDQYFYVIFFGGNRLFELGEGKLLRASEQTKSAAYRFIDSIRPAGGTNALGALERAVQVCDGSNRCVSVIYFLTDGFELTSEDADRFSHRIANLAARFAPEARINTIGFWPADGDCELLKTISKQSGGEFVLANDN